MSSDLRTDSVRAFVAANDEVRSHLAHDPDDPLKTIQELHEVGAKEILQYRIHQLLLETDQYEPPINLYRLAARLGVRRIVRSDLDVDGRIVRCEDSYDIELSTRASRKRQRFSLAHELAHTFFLPFAPKLTKSRSRDKTQKSHWLAEEMLCNYGAAEMLMPAPRFLGDAISIGPSLEALKWLAQRWDVSLQSCMWRIWELKAWPVVFFRLTEIDGKFVITEPIGLDHLAVSLAESRSVKGSRIGRIVLTRSAWLGSLRLSLGGPAQPYTCDVLPSRIGASAQVMVIFHPEAERLCKRSKLSTWSKKDCIGNSEERG